MISDEVPTPPTQCFHAPPLEGGTGGEFPPWISDPNSFPPWISPLGPKSRIAGMMILELQIALKIKENNVRERQKA